MDYSIKAIPTRYNGIEFRSRLEAKWAAFFDQCGWRWEYEPCDFDGWIPDFLLTFNHGTILIEVKPILEFDLGTFLHVIKQEVGTPPKDRTIFLLGACLFLGEAELFGDTFESIGASWNGTYKGSPSDIGKFIPEMGETIDERIYPVVVGECITCKKLVPIIEAGEEANWFGLDKCRNCGRCPGTMHDDGLVWPSKRVSTAWRTACNASKWRPIR